MSMQKLPMKCFDMSNKNKMSKERESAYNFYKKICGVQLMGISEFLLSWLFMPNPDSICTGEEQNKLPVLEMVSPKFEVIYMQSPL